MAADLEYLASFGVDIDEGGVSRLRSVLSENRALAEELAAAFDGAAAAVQAFRESLGEGLPTLKGLAPSAEEGASGFAALRLTLDSAEADASLAAFLERAREPVRLTANASAITSAARTALGNVRALFSSPLILSVRAETETGGASGASGHASGASGESSGNASGSASSPSSAEPSAGTPVTSALRMSSGGRFSRPTSVEVAEDGGTEYIIPVAREGRAVPLVRQLLSEMSPSARESVTGEAGSASHASSEDREAASGALPDIRLLLSGLSAAAPAAAPVSHTQNLSAPVTINVKASGHDPEAVGRGIYDAAERYLLRALRG